MFIVAVSLGRYKYIFRQSRRRSNWAVSQSDRQQVGEAESDGEGEEEAQHADEGAAGTPPLEGATDIQQVEGAAGILQVSKLKDALRTSTLEKCT